MANNGYDRELVLDARRRNLADLVSFGRLFIANPDLVERLRIGAALNVPDRLLLFVGLAGVPALAQCSPPAPPFFFVGGQVKTPKWVNVLALQQLPLVNQNVTYFAAGQVENDTFTGALLWDLLQSVDIVTDPKVKNDILRKIIIVTGTDGYVSVFTAGEIDPGFGGNQIIVAYEDNGQPLGCEGPAQIVAPGDKAGGRFVHNIATIIVEDESK